MNTKFTLKDLFLIEMAIDEIMGRFKRDSANYMKYELLSHKITMLRNEIEKNTEEVAEDEATAPNSISSITNGRRSLTSGQM